MPDPGAACEVADCDCSGPRQFTGSVDVPFPEWKCSCGHEIKYHSSFLTLMPGIPRPTTPVRKAGQKRTSTEREDGERGRSVLSTPIKASAFSSHTGQDQQGPSRKKAKTSLARSVVDKISNLSGYESFGSRESAQASPVLSSVGRASLATELNGNVFLDVAGVEEYFLGLPALRLAPVLVLAPNVDIGDLNTDADHDTAGDKNQTPDPNPAADANADADDDADAVADSNADAVADSNADAVADSNADADTNASPSTSAHLADAATISNASPPSNSVSQSNSDGTAAATEGLAEWWTDPPSPPQDEVFVPWLVRMLRGLRENAATVGGFDGDDGSMDYEWMDTRQRPIPSSYSAPLKPDFCLVNKEVAYGWKAVGIVGEHQSVGKTEIESFLQLADYASHIFASQPLRSQVAGVFSYSNPALRLRLFLFDRGGALGSCMLDVDRVTIPRLARARVIPQSLLPTFPGGGKLTVNKVVCQRVGIVRRGTYCFTATCRYPRGGGGGGDGSRGSAAFETALTQASREELLVKLSWRAAEREDEGELLQRAAERKVIGVAKHVAHGELGRLDALRSCFGDTGIPFKLLPSRSQSPPTSRSTKVTSEPTSSRGWASRTNRSTFHSRSTSASATSAPAAAAKDTSAKGTSAMATAAKVPAAAAKPPADSKAVLAPTKFPNRIHSYIVMSSIGIPISHCTKPIQVAHALLGALIGHASLFFSGGMLHRDVSSSNILLSRRRIPIDLKQPPDSRREDGGRPEQAEGEAAGGDDTNRPVYGAQSIMPTGLDHLCGFLIDLDYAIPYDTLLNLSAGPSGAPHRTGTLPFMAIGVLQGDMHTYRHDLESFLYVLIAACCGYNSEVIETWENGRMQTIAGSKYFSMCADKGFRELSTTFIYPFASRDDSFVLTEVVREWRDILFRVDSIPSSMAGGKIYYLAETRPGWVKGGLSEWDAFVAMRDVLYRYIRNAER